MKECKKIVIIQIDGNCVDLYELMYGFENLGRCMGYEFILTNTQIRSIPKKELIEAITKI